MDRDSIEAKDQRLMQKFRAIVEEKKQTADPVKSPYRGGVMMITAIIVIALIVLPVWLMSNDKPSDSQAPVQKDVGIEEVPEIQIPAPAEENVLASVETEPRGEEPEAVETPAVVEPSSVQPEPVPAPEEKAAEDAPSPVPGVSIADIQTCRGVVDRECESRARVFSLSEAIKPTVWMTVTAENPPFTLTHIYYLNDQVYCTVPLTIGYMRTRTWSRVTVNKENHLGSWRVDVVDGHGQVLDHVNFEVVP